MILTKTFTYRGKEIPVSMMKPNSEKKILVKCPDCGEVRETWLRVIRRKGNHSCHRCTLNKLFSKTLEIGAKYGRLTIISHSEKTGYSICKCECGNIVKRINTNLKNGKSKSCGCLRIENIKKNVKNPIGENHWNWKGGISGERQLFMAKKPYKDWKKFIYERDNYTCQKCGKIRKSLNTHHIEPFSDNESKRIDPDNGIVLCQDCHNKFHSIFGRKDNNRLQLETYLNTNYN